MTGAVAALASMGGPTGMTVSAGWSDIAFASPTTSGSNEDRTISYAGATRNLSAVISGDDISTSLQYRINSGSWTAYAVPFAVTSGQTVGWKVDPIIGAASSTVTVRDATRDDALDAFNVTVTW